MLVSFALMQFVWSGCQKNGIFAGFPRVQDKTRVTGVSTISARHDDFQENNFLVKIKIPDLAAMANK